MADEATHYRILLALQEDVRGMGLAGLPDAQVYLRKAPYGGDVQKPAVIVSPGDREDLEGPASTFRKRHRGYPALITFVPGGAQDPKLTEPEMLWRERIIDRYLGDDEAGTPPALLTAADREWRAYPVEPGPVIDPEFWARIGWYVGSVLLRFYAMK